MISNFEPNRRQFTYILFMSADYTRLSDAVTRQTSRWSIGDDTGCCLWIQFIATKLALGLIRTLTWERIHLATSKWPVNAATLKWAGWSMQLCLLFCLEEGRNRLSEFHYQFGWTKLVHCPTLACRPPCSMNTFLGRNFRNKTGTTDDEVFSRLDQTRCS